MNHQDDDAFASSHPHLDEAIDPVRRIGFLRRAAIRWRHRHLTNRRLWDLRVDFDTLVEANKWDLASNFDDLNDRYQG